MQINYVGVQRKIRANLKGRNRGSKLRTRVTLEIFAKLLWAIAKILGYIVLLTVGFLVIGYFLFEFIGVKRFIELPIIYMGEAFFCLWIGVRAMFPMYLNWYSQLRTNPKTAVVFTVSGLLILIIGLLLGS